MIRRERIYSLFSLPLHILAAFAIGLLAAPLHRWNYGPQSDTGESGTGEGETLDYYWQGRLFWRLIDWQEACFHYWVKQFIWGVPDNGQTLKQFRRGLAYEYCNYVSERLGQGI